MSHAGRLSGKRTWRSPGGGQLCALSLRPRPTGGRARSPSLGKKTRTTSVPSKERLPYERARRPSARRPRRARSGADPSRGRRRHRARLLHARTTGNQGSRRQRLRRAGSCKGRVRRAAGRRSDQWTQPRASRTGRTGQTVVGADADRPVLQRSALSRSGCQRGSAGPLRGSLDSRAGLHGARSLQGDVRPATGLGGHRIDGRGTSARSRQSAPVGGRDGGAGLGRGPKAGRGSAPRTRRPSAGRHRRPPDCPRRPRRPRGPHRR